MNNPSNKDKLAASLEEVQALRARATALAQAESESLRLTMLHSCISLSLIQKMSLQEILHACTKALVEYLDAAFARIWTLNPATQILELQASSGCYTHLNGFHSRIPVGQLKIGMIAQTRQPHLTNEVIGDPLVHDQDWARREGMVAFAGYPLLVEERVVGVMALFARHPLSPSVLDTMGSIANILALRIDCKRKEEECTQSVCMLRHVHELTLQMRNAFLSQVAHDLRNPVTVIQAVISLLQKYLSAPSSPDVHRFREALTHVEGQVMKMNRMIGDLVDVTRLLSEQQLPLALQVLDLVELVQQTVRSLQDTTLLHHITVQASQPTLMIPGDPARLERVCLNLLSNAMKYSPAGSTITVTISQEEYQGVFWAILAVQDQGVGIPAEAMPHLFEPFYRAGNVSEGIPGSGIGLASVSQIVKQHGGTITVHSEEKKGTTFIVRLPCMKDHHSPSHE
jgi:signal transduction histidine kinase